MLPPLADAQRKRCREKRRDEPRRHAAAGPGGELRLAAGGRAGALLRPGAESGSLPVQKDVGTKTCWF